MGNMAQNENNQNHKLSEILQFDIEMPDNDDKFTSNNAPEKDLCGDNSTESTKCPGSVDGAPVQKFKLQTSFDLLLAYVNKFKGVDGMKGPDLQVPHEIVSSCVLSFIGIFLVSVTSFWYLSKQFHGENNTAVTMLTGAYGASAILLYDAYQSPLAQPRNVLGAYLVCSFTGVSVRIICGYIGLERWTTCAFSIAISVVFMNLTKTVHPPGGACALLAVIGGKGIWDLGFGFIATTMGGAFIMLMVALIGNNLLPTRQYPLYWW